NISAQDVPLNNKLSALEKELQEIKSTLDDIHDVIKYEDDLDLYIERLQVLHDRVGNIEEELGRLGLLSSTETEKVIAVLSTADELDMHLLEELEELTLQVMKKGLARVKRNHQRADQREASEKLGSDVVEQAVINRQQLETELELNSSLLQNADELGLIVMELSRPDELPGIQGLIDEYQLLYKDMKARISVLKAECQQQAEIKKKVEEVDESVQVSTLRFEQDTAVQVDTLPPLMRLTSRDAYLYELEAALRESSQNLDCLEEALRCPTPQQVSRSHGNSSQLSKLIATCESSIELIKRLSTLLIEECGATEEYARSEVVQRLSDLISKAKAREQRMREISDNGTIKSEVDDTTILAQEYCFLDRVVRASLSIQAVMVLQLRVAYMVPTGEEDYSCVQSNNIARMLRYLNGPPPV
ncbi:hypothetical protein L9F63_007773, partial [Diploptera punctata]